MTKGERDMGGRMDVLVAKSWEGESGRDPDPEHRIVILLNLGRGGSVDQGLCFELPFWGEGGALLREMPGQGHMRP